jgi:hypothetical protein
MAQQAGPFADCKVQIGRLSWRPLSFRASTDFCVQQPFAVVLMWPDCNRVRILNAKHNSGQKLPLVPSSLGRVGERGDKMGELKTVPVALKKSGVATDTASVAITVTRLFGLDAGDWSMILLGLALSALLLVLA